MPLNSQKRKQERKLTVEGKTNAPFHQYATTKLEENKYCLAINGIELCMRWKFSSHVPFKNFTNEFSSRPRFLGIFLAVPSQLLRKEWTVLNFFSKR